MPSAEFKRQAIQNLTTSLKEWGLRPFVAESGTYGFYTDREGQSVVCFQIDYTCFKFSGNYVTSEPRVYGTGWCMGEACNVSKQQAYNMLHNGPSFIVSCGYRLKTLEEYLKDYQKSSRFVEV